jgi:Zinc-finger domain of monoamine-oxidase A repressor R1
MKLEKCPNCNHNFHLKCEKSDKNTAEKACCTLSNQKNPIKYCHRCQSQTASDKHYKCSNELCKKIYCIRCLKYRYKVDISDIPINWECFVCDKSCSCKFCRKEVNKVKANKVLKDSINDAHSCHQCLKKVSAGKFIHCNKCSNYLCLGCLEGCYKSLDSCPICLDICSCKACGDLRFNKDFPDFHKGVDLRKLYPYDLDNIFYVNGFWVRSINL